MSKIVSAPRRHLRVACLFAVPACLLLLSLVKLAHAGEISFAVQEPSGAERVAWPVQGGVPFALGELKDSDAVELVDAEGQSIPLQAAPLAKWWNDGSVKWLLVDFFADIPSGGARTYTLRYGADARPAAASSPLKAAKTDQGVEIDTGVMRTTIGPRFVHSLSVRGDDGQWKELVTGPGELWMTVNGQNEGRYAASLDKTATVEIEEQGPNRVAVLVKGVHTAPDGRTFGPYILRVHAYANKPYLRVFHSFINSDIPERGLITGIGMRVPFDYEAGATVSYGGLTEKAKGGWPGWVEEVDGDKQVVIHDGQHRDLDGRQRAYLAVSNDAGTMACFGRHWRQLHPKKMDIAANGLTVWLWPASRGAFDIRREEQRQSEAWLDYKNNHPELYRKWHDPSTVRSVGMNMTRFYNYLERRAIQSFSKGTALGISRTHEMFFVFGDGDLDREALDRISLSVEDALIPYPSAAHISSTLVLGPFGAKDRADFPLTENYMEHKLDWIVNHQNLKEWTRWWGIVDWGGTKSFYEVLHGDKFPREWHSLAGRHGWRNGEVDIPHAMMYPYLRTGDRRAWRFFESLVRHQMDVDTMHANPPEYDAPDYELDRWKWAKGGTHRHSYNHTTGAPNDQHTWNEGLANYYFLTGDRRAREVALESAEFNYGSPLGKVPSAFELYQDNEKWWRPFARNAVNCWRTSMKAYEMTGEEFWKNDVDRWREHFVAGYMDFLNKYGEKASTYQVNHYLVQTLVCDYYMSRDERVGDLIADLAKWNIEFMKKKKTDRGLNYPFLACGVAWQIKRDDELLRWPFHTRLAMWQSQKRQARHNDFHRGDFYEYNQLPYFIEACVEAGYSEANPPAALPEGYAQEPATE